MTQFNPAFLSILEDYKFEAYPAGELLAKDTLTHLLLAEPAKSGMQLRICCTRRKLNPEVGLMFVSQDAPELLRTLLKALHEIG